MKITKKIFAILMAVMALSCTLTGCGDKDVTLITYSVADSDNNLTLLSEKGYKLSKSSSTDYDFDISYNDKKLAYGYFVKNQNNMSYDSLKDDYGTSDTGNIDKYEYFFVEPLPEDKYSYIAIRLDSTYFLLIEYEASNENTIKSFIKHFKIDFSNL